jgi:hypothetical protein
VVENKQLKRQVTLAQRFAASNKESEEDDPPTRDR